MNKKTEKTKKESKSPEVTIIGYKPKPCVRIEKADNGYTICTHGITGEKTLIAKTMDEALKSAKKLMGKKDKVG